MDHPDDLASPAAHVREPAVAFDFNVLDSPLDLAHEELESVLGRKVSRAEAETLWHWHLRQTAADKAAERTVAERILIWIGGGRPMDYIATGKGSVRPEETEEARAERRIGLRAAIVIGELAPHAEQDFSVRELCRIFGVSRGLVWKLTQNFREMVKTPEA